MKKVFTLCLIKKDDRVLLGYKKRGHGIGKWNGFGGKVLPNEPVEDAMVREVEEESGLILKCFEKIALIDFAYPGESEVWETHLFTSSDYLGEPQNTEEMKPQWFKVDELPFDLMWPDDKHWFPYFLNGKKFRAQFNFDKDNNIVAWSINEAK